MRHQPTLQPVGEPSDDATEVLQLLVEIVAQPLQFLRLAQVLGVDDLVEPGRIGLVVGPAPLAGRLRRAVFRRFLGFAGRRFVGEVGRGRIVGLDRAVFEFVGRFVRRFPLHRVGRFLALAFALGVFGALGRRVLFLRFRVVVLVGLGIARQVERFQQTMQ